MNKLLERNNDSPHRQEAVFFYEKTTSPEGIGARIVKTTQTFFEQHAYKPFGKSMVVAQCQLISGELIETEDRIAGAGPMITLTHNGGNIYTDQSVWHIAIAEQGGGVEVLEFITSGGCYILSKKYNQQGKLTKVSNRTDVNTAWSLVEACMWTEDAQRRMRRVSFKQSSSDASVRKTEKPTLSDTAQSKPPDGGIFLPERQSLVPGFIINLMEKLPEIQSESARVRPYLDDLLARTKQLRGYGYWWECHLKNSKLTGCMPGEVIAVVAHIEKLYETTAAYADAQAAISRQANQAARYILSTQNLFDEFSACGYEVQEIHGRKRLIWPEVGKCAIFDYFHPLPEHHRYASTEDHCRLLSAVMTLQ